MKNNIILIGMPGAGKSTIGVLLAKALNMGFIDTDIVLQQQTGNSLQDIINNEGLSKFMSLEEAMIMSLNLSDSVISTGGSVIYSKNGMLKLAECGLIVFLDVELDMLKKRLKNITTRGVAMPKDVTIDMLYHERLPLYKLYADRIIICENLSMEDITEKIIQVI